MTIVIKAGRLILNFLYLLIKLIPMQRKVTMISRQSNEPSIEFRMIKNKIEKKDPGVKVVLLCRTLDGGVNSSFAAKLKYGLHIFTQMVHIASSRVIILDTYCIAVSLLNHKKGLKIIQMWHSMGTMKKFGYTALDTEEGTKHALAYAMRMHENYDYVFASSDAYKEHLARGFNCDISKIITMPLPRLDLLQSSEYGAGMRRKIYSKYPELAKKPVILYCPTFRKNEEAFERAFYRLAEAIDTKKFCFVAKLHPLSKVTLAPDIICAKGFSSFDMLFAADYVISDYSCIVYEAAVLGIPLYFYNFDMEEYLDGRGLAVDYYGELPGVISGEASEIAEAIGSGEYDLEKLEGFARKYVRPTKHATEDIVDFVLQFIN